MKSSDLRTQRTLVVGVCQIDQLENAITRQRAMQLKVVKSVSEKWYELDWIRESKLLSKYGELILSKKLQREKAISDAKGLPLMSE